jgi:hypothetical protein
MSPSLETDELQNRSEGSVIWAWLACYASLMAVLFSEQALPTAKRAAGEITGVAGVVDGRVRAIVAQQRCATAAMAFPIFATCWPVCGDFSDRDWVGIHRVCHGDLLLHALSTYVRPKLKPMRQEPE